LPFKYVFWKILENRLYLADKRNLIGTLTSILSLNFEGEEVSQIYEQIIGVATV
jgi:hypothetical protein